MNADTAGSSFGQEADIALDHRRDLGAGGVEDVGEFTVDRAAADDDQALVVVLFFGYDGPKNDSDVK